MSIFVLNEESKQIELIEHPATSGYPSSASELITLFESSSYADCAIEMAAVRALFAPSQTIPAPPYVIAKALDATIEIHVDEANMLAEARVVASSGGEIVTPERALSALADAGVTKGINERALEKFLAKQFELMPNTEMRAIVAHGKRAKDGVDAKFVRLCATAQDRVLSPQAKEDGKVDMRDLGAIITVNPGTPLMQKIPPTMGEDGYTVFGDILAATPGKDADFSVSEGTCLDPENRNILIADAVGVPVAIARGIRVDDVLCYDNVDVSTGHVKFDGSVIVSGDVKDGMKVIASGDITVLGFVENAELESESDITVMHGAIGRKREAVEDPFTCSIKAKRNISIGFAQFVRVEGESDLFIERQVLHSYLKVRRILRVGKGDKPHGKIIGGRVLDALRIEAGEIGAPSGTKTILNLAQSVDSLREKQQQMKELEKQLSDRLVTLKTARNKALKIPSPAQQQKYLAKVESSLELVNTKLKRVYRNQKLLERKIQVQLKSARVTVNDILHPGIEVLIAKEKAQFARIYPPHKIALVGGKIEQKFT